VLLLPGVAGEARSRLEQLVAFPAVVPVSLCVRVLGQCGIGPEGLVASYAFKIIHISAFVLLCVLFEFKLWMLWWWWVLWL